MKSWKKPTPEVVEKALASTKREPDRIYFFSRLTNPLWLEELEVRGYFKFPPPAKKLPDGYVQYPSWPELTYIAKVAEVDPDRATDVILRIPDTDNVRIYQAILEIALKLDVEKSVRLKPKLIEYAKMQPAFLGHGFDKLLRHWASDSVGHLPALGLVDELVSFMPDPGTTTKIARRKTVPDDIFTILEPQPRFEEWEYHAIITKGVNALAEVLPYEVAGSLCGALKEMVALKHSSDESGRERWDDWSVVWCERVDAKIRRYPDAKEGLVSATTFACEKVYEKQPGKVAALDQILRDGKWRVFDRIRQHLYAKYPSEQTKPWIREIILGHEVYGRREYGYEFHRMVRAATDHFDDSLLSKGERVTVFDAILSGPSKEDFRQFVGKDFSEELFEKRRRYFHLKHLSPFRAVLFGKYQTYADELVAGEGGWPSDEEFFFFRSGDVKEGQEKSPKDLEELERMPDEELLHFINEWEDAHRDWEEWWVEISFEGLGREFQKIFREKVAPDSERLAFWLGNVTRIERPFYVRRILFALTEVVKAKDFSHLEGIFNLCDWVLTHPEVPKSGEKMREVARDFPCWRSSRRAVCDFIGTCLDKEVTIPIEWRERCAVILRQLCTDYDRRLDEDEPVFLNREDQLTEAINQTRGRALENLVDFGRWIRRHKGGGAPVPEVFEVLDHRFEVGPIITLPEHALLGLQFVGLFGFNAEWAEEKRSKIFPQGQEAWIEAFGNFLRFNRPFRDIYPLIEPEFRFALRDIKPLRTEKHQRKEILDSIGEHLFSYYVWGIIPLEGEESLLERFYSVTAPYPSSFSLLFDHVGRVLRNSGPAVDAEMTGRITAFFEKRLSAENNEEMSEFTFWLEAGALPAEWRLTALSRILDLAPTKGIGKSLQLDALEDLLTEHPDLVVTCLAKMTETGNVEEYFYFQSKNVKPILRAGLLSDNSETSAAAERARENLLKAGRFEFLHVAEEGPEDKE